MTRPKPLILAILDGFGVSIEKTANPIHYANAPTLKELEYFYPFVTLQASGAVVGLPWGVAGNSEVGHLTIGSGRVTYHHLPRIINSIYDGSFFTNTAFKNAAAHVKSRNSRLHIAGLVSSGSVHSYIDHLYALLDFSKREDIEKTFIHIFTDGKDSPPKEGAKFIRMLKERAGSEWPKVSVASIIGRHYAMDREDRWERTGACYKLITEGVGKHITSAAEHLESSYAKGITDEFIEPAIVDYGENGRNNNLQENDAIIFLNFREDSMRQLLHAFVEPGFNHFPRQQIKNIHIVTMTEYEKGLLGVTSAFEQLDIAWPLARVLGEAGLSHLHIAETEKYAHITYFLNGGKEKPFMLEERVLIPSLPISHVDEAPEMRAREITDTIIKRLRDFDVVIVNFANADMVGHSGNFKAAVGAVEIIDECLLKIKKAIEEGGGALIITADHGNIELKRNVISGEKITEHSLSPVPLFIVGKKYRKKNQRTDEELKKIKEEPAGILTDVAPTMIELLGIQKPQEMTGRSLLASLTNEHLTTDI